MLLHITLKKTIAYRGVERELIVHKSESGCRSDECPYFSITSVDLHRNDSELIVGGL